MFEILIGLVGLGYFAAISLATRRHFKSGRYPAGMFLISALSVAGITVFALHAFWLGLHFQVLALPMILVAFALFEWAIRHSRNGVLALAFDTESQSERIIDTGPWRYMRHPFYASYGMFWLATALATQHIASVFAFLSLFSVYVYSAFREEGALTSGPLREEYLAYRKNVGFLLPKLSNRNGFRGHV